MPIIDNIYGETPLHYSLQNMSVAEFYFAEVLPFMPFDHHSRAIDDILPKCISNKVPNLGEYMDSRFLQSQSLENLNRANNKTVKGNKGYYITACD